MVKTRAGMKADWKGRTRDLLRAVNWAVKLEL